MRSTTLLLLGIAALLTAQAQTWPTRPVRIVVAGAPEPRPTITARLPADGRGR